MRRAPPAFAALVALAVLAACGGGDAGISAQDPWIREAPPGASTMAAYVVLRNGARSAVRCDAVSGPDFGSAEIHHSMIEDGRMRMHHVPHIEIPARGELRLEPGSYHIMLFAPARALVVGDTAELSLRCGEHTITARYTVRAP